MHDPLIQFLRVHNTLKTVDVFNNTDIEIGSGLILTDLGDGYSRLVSVGGSGGAQTPWFSDIDADHFSLLNLSSITFAADSVPTNRTISVADQTVNDTDGNSLYFSSGAGKGTGASGRVVFYPADGKDTGAGGDLYFNTGYGSGALYEDSKAGDMIFTAARGNPSGRFLFTNAPHSAGELDFSLLSASRKFTFPDKSGTLATIDDVTGGAWDNYFNDGVPTLEASPVSVASTVLTYLNAWHIQVRKVATNQYVMIMSVQEPPTRGKYLWYFTSSDRTNWSSGTLILSPTGGTNWDSNNIYRSACLPDDANNSFKLWYSGFASDGDRHIGFTEDTAWTYPNAPTVTNAANPLVTPTWEPGNSGQTVHPDVVYVSAGWNGYTYWMVTGVSIGNPLNEDYEEPMILASNDGTTWEVPAGLTNPIIPLNTQSSDPCMLLVGSTMYVYYRQNLNGDTTLYRTSSTNGTTWTSPTTVKAYSPSGSMASPSVMYEGTTWYMYYVDTLSGKVLLETSTDGVNFASGFDGGVIEANQVDILGYRSINFYTGAITTVGLAGTIDNYGRLGWGTTSPAYHVDIQDNINGAEGLRVKNSNAGVSALSYLRADNDVTNGFIRLMCFGSGYTTSGAFRQRGSALDSDLGQTGGLSIISRAASSDIRLYAGGSADANLKATFDSTGNLEMSSTTNSSLGIYIANTNSGDSAFSYLAARNGTDPADAIRMMCFGTGYTTSGAYLQDSGIIEAGNNLSGGLHLVSRSASSIMRFYVGGIADANEKMFISYTGSIDMFPGALGNDGGNAIKFTNRDFGAAGKLPMISGDTPEFLDPIVAAVMMKNGLYILSQGTSPNEYGAIVFANSDLSHTAGIICFPDLATSFVGTSWNPNDDETHDLGQSGNRWKDLYLSGDANIGGDINLTGTINTDQLSMTPTLKEVVQTVTLPQDANGGLSTHVKILGNLAYVVLQNDDNTNCLRIFDITDPKAPVLIGGDSFDGGYHSFRWIDVADGYAYIGWENASQNAGFMIVDVSDPTTPTLVVAKEGGSGGLDFGGSVRSTQIIGNTLYLSCYDTGTLGDGFQIWDVTTKSAPTRVSAGVTGLPTGNRSTFVLGNYAYTVHYTGTTNDSFRVIDISTPATPVIVGGASLGVSVYGRQVVARQEGDKIYAYCVFDAFGPSTDNGIPANGAFRIVDVTNPAAPAIVGGTGLTFPIANSTSGIDGIVVDGKYAYVTESKSQGGSIRTIDVSDVTNPTFAKILPVVHATDEGGFPWGIDKINNYLYVILSESVYPTPPGDAHSFRIYDTANIDADVIKTDDLYAKRLTLNFETDRYIKFTNETIDITGIGSVSIPTMSSNVNPILQKAVIFSEQQIAFLNRDMSLGSSSRNCSSFINYDSINKTINSVQFGLYLDALGMSNFFIDSTLLVYDASNDTFFGVNALSYSASGTPPIADGTYNMGKITPGTGTTGTITVKGGIVTAITQAT